MRSAAGLPRRRSQTSTHSPLAPVRLSGASVLRSPTNVKFRERAAFIGQLEHGKDLLDWDQQLHMPRKGAAARAKLSAALETQIHGLKTDKATLELARRVVDQAQKAGDGVAKRNAELFLWDANREARVPTALASELAAAVSACQDIWAKQARPAAKFSLVRNALDKVVRLARERAQAIDSTRTPYAVLMEKYERALTPEQVTQAFTSLRDGLLPLIERGRSVDLPATTMGADWQPAEMHAFLVKHVVKPMGFRFDAGRADWSTTAHPCCLTLDPRDVRLISRFDKPYSFPLALKYNVHEAGHGLYNQGLPTQEKWLDQPIGEPASMAVHESQSLLWEKRVAHGLPFLTYLGRCLSTTLAKGREANSITLELYRAMHRVQPGFKRIHADEVTYPLHIIIRFELEQALMNGAIQVDDMPEAFRAKVKQYLGLDLENDGQGVLQDVHWYAGYFGYFPTYTLGAIYGAQVFAAAGREIDGLAGLIERGEFLPLREWLRGKIHQHGNRFEAAALMQQVTAQQLDPQSLIDVLTSEYDPARF